MPKRTSTIDWERIGLEYCSGEDSIREIADRHEISDTAIRKRAKAEKWVRTVRTPIWCEPMRTLPLRAPPPSAVLPAEAGATADRGRGLVARMMDELDTVTSRAGELEDMIVAECASDRQSRRREAMLKAVSLDGRANTMKTLAIALKTLNEAAAPAGKKEAAQEASRSAGAGTGWGDDLGAPSTALN